MKGEGKDGWFEVDFMNKDNIISYRLMDYIPKMEHGAKHGLIEFIDDVWSSTGAQ